MNEIAPVRDPKIATVIRELLSGASLRDSITAAGMTPSEFHYRLGQDRAAAVAYSRAQEARADFLADEALHIADTSDDAAKARNQITIRQWLAGKLNSKKFGDRIDLNVTQVLDISSTLAEARARLRPVSDQQDIIDVQPVDYQRESASRPTDKQSLSPPPDAVPDIFD